MKTIVEREIEVVAFAVVAGYCDEWAKAGELVAARDARWVGVHDEIKALGLHAEPSRKHLSWSIAAGLAVHAAEFDGVAVELDEALVVANRAIQLTGIADGVVHV